MQLTDTHCHLNFHAFDEDRGKVVERARAAGVVRMLNPAVDLPTSLQILELAAAIPELHAAVGIHPNDSEAWSSASLQQLEQLAASHKVVAIGEIGLDYYWKKAPPDVQKSIFTDQLELAARVNLPVVIHNREADEDVMQILEAWHASLVEAGSALAQRPGVLHSFSGSQMMADRALKLGFFIGITGPVTFKKAQELRDLAARVPENQLLIETDAPFLTPEPFRGKRNEPSYVLHIADKIAEIKNISRAEAARITTQNAARLFDW